MDTKEARRIVRDCARQDAGVMSHQDFAGIEAARRVRGWRDDAASAGDERTVEAIDEMGADAVTEYESAWQQIVDARAQKD